MSYFQVVFTLPSELSRLALGNRREIDDLLFTASWRALKKTIETEQGFDPAALMVLHTWNQKLEAHHHVHAVVPAGGPSLTDRGVWKPTTRHGRVNPFYLVDAPQLRKHYRETFLQGFGQVHARGGLKLEGEFSDLKDPSTFEGFLRKLASVSWGLNLQPPPCSGIDPTSRLKYLTRYLTGGPISDRRLIEADDRRVRFWARAGKINGGDRQRRSEPMQLSGVEFVRRWSLHILPKGYVRSRRFGGWSNRLRAEYLQECRDLVGTEAPALEILDGDRELSTESATPPNCPHCDQPMRLIADQHKPSWRDLFASPHRPRWYRDSG